MIRDSPWKKRSRHGLQLWPPQKTIARLPKPTQYLRGPLLKYRHHGLFPCMDVCVIAYTDPLVNDFINIRFIIILLARYLC